MLHRHAFLIKAYTYESSLKVLLDLFKKTVDVVIDEIIFVVVYFSQTTLQRSLTCQST